MLLPVSLGVAAATAVIVGALLVGDSVRGSLHFLATDRLGDFDSVSIAPRFFPGSVLNDSRRTNEDLRPLPAILFPKAAIGLSSNQENAQRESHRVGNAMVLGIDANYWNFGERLFEREIGLDEIVVNQALADELTIKEGDRLTVRFPSQSAVPADNPLGKRDTETVNLPNLRVAKILPNRSIARFDLRSNQRPSLNAFVSIRAIQNALDRPGEINAVFWGRPRASNHSNESFNLSLRDLGFSVARITQKFPDRERGEAETDQAPQTIFDYYQLTTDQMLLPKPVVESIFKRWPVPKSSPILTYLANGIELRGDDVSKLTIPYSTISGIAPELFEAPSVGFGQQFSKPGASGAEDSLEDMRSTWKDDEVLVNQWLADQLNLKIGDPLKIDYYLPETIDGSEIEKSFDVTIKAILPFTEPEVGYRRNRSPRFAKAPTPFNDSALTPEVPGITDQASISDWDLPFLLTRKIRKEDDDYWTNHRLSPKLFLTLNKAQALFGSRFGNVSSIRFPVDVANSEEALEEQILAELKPLMSKLGWTQLPIREHQLAAAKGTTPFDALFLSLSFFVILASLLLVALLFRLAMERRASQWGTLLAMGWPIKRLSKLLVMEGLSLAFAGALIGVPLGIGYAAAVLALLRTWWVGAVGAPFLQFYMTLTSLIVGVGIGILAAWLTIRISLRSISRLPTLQLMRGRTEIPAARSSKISRWSKLILAGLGTSSMAVVCTGFYASGQAAGGAFVGAGMLSLATILFGGWIWMKARRGRLESGSAVRSIESLASTSIARQPLRSALTMGLMATATLLILSMGLFELSPTVQGTGGFQWMAESSVSIAKSLNDEAYRRQVLGEKDNYLASVAIVPLRVRDGDDAGCNNLYQASQPRVLGVGTRMAEFQEARSASNSFAWAAKPPAPNETRWSAWRLIESPADGSSDSPIPVIVDQNTAMWALHLTGGLGQKFSYEMDGRRLHFVMVAQLQNTVLQGSLLIGEENFTRVFPSISGYRNWLIHSPKEPLSNEVEKVLETGWADEGMDVIATSVVLSNLLAVQNTYLKAFQSLGALGLLLGAFGLAVVQMRSVMERRAEFGLFRAMGFSRGRVGRLVLSECLALLFAGLGIGVASAAFALIPALVSGLIAPNYGGPLLLVVFVAVIGTLAGLSAVRMAMRLNPIESIRQG
jgi:ABC-type antimicrobial peptide transport system permease subunit